MSVKLFLSEQRAMKLWLLHVVDSLSCFSQYQHDMFETAKAFKQASSANRLGSMPRASHVCCPAAGRRGVVCVQCFRHFKSAGSKSVHGRCSGVPTCTQRIVDAARAHGHAVVVADVQHRSLHDVFGFVFCMKCSRHSESNLIDLQRPCRSACKKWERRDLNRMLGGRHPWKLDVKLSGMRAVAGRLLVQPEVPCFPELAVGVGQGAEASDEGRNLFGFDDAEADPFEALSQCSVF